MEDQGKLMKRTQYQRRRRVRPGSEDAWKRTAGGLLLRRKQEIVPHPVSITFLALMVARGKMRKRVWVNAGDIILVSLRDYQDSKADVIAKYTPDEARSLKAYGELPESTKINETDLYDEEGDGGIDFQDVSSDSENEDGKEDAKFDIDDL